MSDFRKVSLLVIPLSFALGLWWGIKLLSHQGAATDKEVRVLTYRGLVPKSLVAIVSENLQLNLVIKEVSSTKEWRESLETQESFDLLAPMSFQVEALVGQGRLTALPALKSLKKQVVSPDFLKLPFDPEDLYSLPLFWGTTEDSRLWVQVVSLDARAKNTEAAQKVLNFLASVTAVKSFLDHHAQASVYKAVEASSVSEELKPSFLRQFPLSQLKWLEISAAADVESTWYEATKL